VRAVAGRNRRRIADRQDLQERAAELGQRVHCAKGMAGDRRQREAEPLEGRARGIQVADGKDEMVDRTGHGCRWA
jgi:hypothetical protein